MGRTALRASSTPRNPDHPVRSSPPVSTATPSRTNRRWMGASSPSPRRRLTAQKQKLRRSSRPRFWITSLRNRGSVHSSTARRAAKGGT